MALGGGCWTKLDRRPIESTAISHETDDASEARLPTDQDLLKRVATGDGAAFGLLAERLTPSLRRVLFRLGLTEAEIEDSLQDALIRVWHRSASFAVRCVHLGLPHRPEPWRFGPAYSQGCHTFVADDGRGHRDGLGEPAAGSGRP